VNKLLLLLLFFCCSHAGAQDSLAAAPKVETIYVQSDVAVDTAAIEAKTFRKDFRKKYADENFVYEPKAHKKNAWERFKEWLADIINNLFRFSSNKTSMQFVEIMLQAIAIIIVLVVIYMIVKALMNKEGKWIFGKNSDKKLIHYTEIEKNLHLADFEKLIRSTLESGEKRLSIRYYYLWLLKKMSAAQLIVWDIEKTNSDYLHELQSQARKDEFAYLSYLYNYIWYGEFEIDDAIFGKAKSAFETAIKSIRND
jgi:hypothetical protein